MVKPIANLPIYQPSGLFTSSHFQGSIKKTNLYWGLFITELTALLFEFSGLLDVIGLLLAYLFCLHYASICDCRAYHYKFPQK